MQSSANDTQVGGTHYQSSVQHWDWAASNNLGYFEGCITKYVYRWRSKNGLEDLHKANHFLTKLIELTQQRKAPWVMLLLFLYNAARSLPDVMVARYEESVGRFPTPIPTDHFLKTNNVPHLESYIIRNVAHWNGSLEKLRGAQLTLDTIIHAEEDREEGGPTPRYVDQD